MQPETLEQLTKLGPLSLALVALVLFLVLAIVLAPKLLDFWKAGARRDDAMGKELPRMRESLEDIADNTKILARIDTKIDGVHDKLDLLLIKGEK